MKIKSPDTTHSGVHHFGDTVVEFRDGVAEVDGDLPVGVRQYMLGAGYTVGSSRPTATEQDVPAPPDPREVTHVQGGTALRDAAVDPQPGDFLPPTNAGKAGEKGNPHGPHVVAPEIHAAGDQPVVPGPVGKFDKDDDGADIVVPDADAQEARETEYAKRALAGDESVPEVLASIGDKAGVPAPTPEQMAREEQAKSDARLAQLDEGDVLKGEALDQALRDAGLPLTGKADEKRQRLAEHNA